VFGWFTFAQPIGNPSSFSPVHALRGLCERDFDCEGLDFPAFGLLLFTHPPVLGAARPLVDSLDRGGLDWPPQLDLLEHKSFDNGVTMHPLRRPRRTEPDPSIRVPAPQWASATDNQGTVDPASASREQRHQATKS
jgi:hypothetical protein